VARRERGEQGKTAVVAVVIAVALLAVAAVVWATLGLGVLALGIVLCAVAPLVWAWASRLRRRGDRGVRLVAPDDSWSSRREEE
jgi:Flp pilus assembly protein TadB